MTTSSRIRYGALSVALMLGGSLAVASPASAQQDATGRQLEVTSGADSGPGSLREAVDTANSTPGEPSTITFAPTLETVTVSSTITLAAPITFAGTGTYADDTQTEIRYAPASPDSGHALFEADGVAVQLDTITLSGTGGELTGIEIDGAEGLAGKIKVTDSRVRGFGTEGIEISGVSSSSITVSGSELRDNGRGLGIWRAVNTAVTVTDTAFVGNTSNGMSLENYTAPEGTGALIERVQFAGNGASGDQTAGGLKLSGKLANSTQSDSTVQIRNSVFTDNRGFGSGALVYEPGWGDAALGDTPWILVSGSTFVGNIGGKPDQQYESQASSILVNAVPARRMAEDPADEPSYELPLVFRVENSTFDGSAAAAEGLTTALLTESYGGSRTELDQVTAVSSTVNILYGAPGERLQLSRSVIESGDSDPLPGSAASEAGETQPIFLTDTVFTAESEALDVTAGTSQLLAASTLGLGALGDNGGDTPTILPATDSPLVNAVTEAGPLTVDQRGLPRPAHGASDIGAVEVQEGQPVVDSTVSVVKDLRVANGEVAVFSIERSGEAATADLPAATVKISTADGSALAGTDYTASEATLSWAAGETGARSFSVPTAKRTGPLSERAFTVTLSEPSADLTIARATATATLPELESATTPSVTPPGPGSTGKPDEVANTGGNNPTPWIIAAAIAALAGAGLIAARRATRA